MTHQKTHDISVIILAAGKGSRMKSSLPKVMHKIAGRPMINWVIGAAETLHPSEIVVVIGPDMQDLSQTVAPHKAVVQETQMGTADAVKAALPHLENKCGKVLILLGDEPFLSVSALEKMVEMNAPSIMAFHTDDPAGFGRMVQKADHTLLQIVEEKDAGDLQKQIELCNAGNFCLDYEDLEKWLPHIGNDNAQGEYYLTDLPEIAAKDQAFFHIVEVEAEQGWGINDRTQLAVHESYMQDILRVEAMQDGVTMIDPMTIFLSWDTVFGQDILIEPNVFFGEGVEVADGVQIKAFSHIEKAKIGKKSVIGPFARLRPGADLDENVKIGNFVEIKNAKLFKGVKANHHGYIGDAEVGAGTNFSCGAITVNYDGYQKHKTIIGENVMVGSNVSLIAPIEVGDGAFIAAGTTISENIPADALAIERQKPDFKKGWAVDYKKRKQKK